MVSFTGRVSPLPPTRSLLILLSLYLDQLKNVTPFPSLKTPNKPRLSHQKCEPNHYLPLHGAGASGQCTDQCSQAGCCGGPCVCRLSYQPINAELIDSNYSFRPMHLTALNNISNSSKATQIINLPS